MTTIPNCELIHETDEAILIELLTGNEEPEIDVNRFWIPKSVVEDYDDVQWLEDGDGFFLADLEVAEWWFDKNDSLQEAIERAEAFESECDT